MSAPETMLAASSRLRGGTPRDEAVADWLAVTAELAEPRIAIWRRCEQDIPGLIHAHYRWPLAVARAVIDEVGV